jgi:2-polyprenyl-3-methyl-5-hydroxy-6-metoxy-1,4-benzoquinol methylase
MTDRYYKEEADKYIKDTVELDMGSLHKKFRAYLPKGGSLLDAGCGSGRDSLAFKKLGYNVYAFDVSEAMVEATKKLADVKVEKMSFQDMQYDRKFDGIWACASLLHVPRKELCSAFNTLSENLEDGGVLYASFKYGCNEREKDGRYFNDLNEELLEEFIKNSSDLEIVDTYITGDVRPGREKEKWLNALIIKNG